MSTPSEKSNEFEELLGALRDGLITPEQAARLEQRLAADPDARAYYLEYITLCATLRYYQGHVGQGRGNAGGAPTPESLLFPIAQGAMPEGTRPRWRDLVSRRLLWFSAAAAVLLVGVLLSWSWPKGGRVPAIPDDSPPTADVRPAADIRSSGGIALVTRLEAVRWEPSGQERPREGMVLTVGRFQVGSGRATLTFLSGVTLTLEGPADVDLISSDRIFCRRGKLRARVPRDATGFVVASPGSAVLDLGTEFGLNVAADGKSRIMVFEGLASAALLDAAGSPNRTQLVEQSEAFELDPSTGRIAETDAQPEGFVPAPSLSAPSLALDPGYAEAILLSRPKGYWRFESGVGGEVPNEVAGSPPLKISGSIRIEGGSRGNGYAAFKAGAPEQFMTTDGLWELAREPGHAVELWFLSEGIGYTSLVGLFPPREFNVPGQETRYLHTFFVELTAQARPSLHKPASVRFLHRWPVDIKVEFNVYSEDYYRPQCWHHVVAQKDGDRMELYFDGVASRPLTLDPDHPTLPCHLVVGRRTPESQNPRDSRSFVGRLDELAIYDHPLSDEEIERHFRLATQGDNPG